jgi:endonuclease YncB( thermonuclease family)
MSYKQFSKVKDFSEAEVEARKVKLGLWADHTSTSPWKARKKKGP